jgi:hypothetical protein
MRVGVEDANLEYLPGEAVKQPPCEAAAVGSVVLRGRRSEGLAFKNVLR